MTQLMVEIVGVWLVAILLGFPLFASMGMAAFAFVLLSGLSGSIVPQKMAQAMNSFPLVAAPLFILMGNILARPSYRPHRALRDVVGGIAARRICARQHPVEHDLRGHGGLGGRRCRRDWRGRGPRDEEGRLSPRDGCRDQRRRGNDRSDHSPSLPMVIYGVAADASIGRLFVAGIVPGVLMGVSLMIMVAIIAPRQGLPRHAFGGLCDVWVAFKGCVLGLLTP
jgi:hypothetical protein